MQPAKGLRDEASARQNGSISCNAVIGPPSMSLADDPPKQKSNEPMRVKSVDYEVPNRFTVLGPLKMLVNPVAQLTSTVMDLIGLISVALAASKLLFVKKRRGIFMALFYRQIYNTGVRALYINGAIGVLVGTLLISRLFDYIPNQVMEDQFGYLFMVIVFRELGPLISGVILIARSATAITAEIGYLRLRREFQVLNGLGISLNEIAINGLKAVLGGMMIGVISIHFGAKVESSFTEVSDAISNSTTTQLMVFFVINILLSVLAYTQ
ncbi:ABC transporter permease [Pseudomonadales bacterium]|nr:ABC transporter permease [Pseudomonadales bacterium]